MSAALPRRDRLQAAADYIADCKRAGHAASDVICGLIDHHGARYRGQTDPYTLRVAGLVVSCTWSKDEGLVDAWSRRATLELLKLDGRCA